MGHTQTRSPGTTELFALKECVQVKSSEIGLSKKVLVDDKQQQNPPNNKDHNKTNPPNRTIQKAVGSGAALFRGRGNPPRAWT